MRWKLGTGLIGGCGCHAVLYGVVAEIGPARKVDPVNPCDIGTAPSMQATNLPPFSPVVINPLVIGPKPYFPMTGHQRLYKWPDTGVGPHRYFDEQTGWGVSKPPVEVAAGQNDWPTIPVCSVPIAPSDANAPVARPALITETILPQRGNSTLEYWTLYQTAPWANTVFVRENPYGGDTRKFRITGVTLNNLGAPLAGVTVKCMYVFGIVNGMTKYEVAGTATSDGSGNVEFLVNPSIACQLVAYHETTEVGGISLDHLKADVSVNIYCTAPGVAPSGGGTVIMARTYVR
jgi:hypothetical protein